MSNKGIARDLAHLKFRIYNITIVSFTIIYYTNLSFKVSKEPAKVTKTAVDKYFYR